MLRLRFQEDLTRSEIGERIGVSQLQVSRIMRRALTALRSSASTVNDRSVAPAPATAHDSSPEPAADAARASLLGA